MEAASKFPESLRSSYRATKMFLWRPKSAVAEEPSLRSRARRALEAARGADHTLSGDSDERATITWIRRFDAAVDEFHGLVHTLGLSVMDRDYFDQHLVHETPLGKLPFLEFVIERLREVQQLSEAIAATIDRRSTVLSRIRRTCVSRRIVACTHQMHEKLAHLLREIDTLTMEIMRLVSAWREYFQFPLPFLHQGENVLILLSDQYAVGSELSLANAHLRTTSRYSPFFYASPFDAVTAGKIGGIMKDAVSQWSALVLGEVPRQRESLHVQLTFARMGLYHCTLSLPRDVLHMAGMKPGLLIQITDRHKKRMLVNCFASAYKVLLRTRLRGSGSVTHSVAGLATFSSKSLHVQYFRRWLEWVCMRRERRELSCDVLQRVEMAMLRRRFHTWLARIALQRRRAERWKPFLYQSQLKLLVNYTQRWFLFHSVGAIGRSVRRALFLRYFRRFHYIVACNRYKKQQQNETFRVIGGNYPIQCQFLAAVAQCCEFAALKVVVAGRDASIWRHMMAYDEWSARYCLTIESQESWIAIVAALLPVQFVDAAHHLYSICSER